MAILVTGAAGFVGIAVVEHLLGQGRDVTGFDRQPMPEAVLRRLAALPGRLVFQTGDVRDPSALHQALSTPPAEAAIHLAAVTAGPARETERAWDSLTVNLAALAPLMQAAAAARLRRVVIASSVAVYGPDAEDGTLLTEDMPPEPATLYAMTKASGEPIALRLAGRHGLDCRIGRLGRVFGADEYDTGVRDTLSQILTVTRAAAERRTVHLARPCRKNWHDAADAAAGLVALLDAPALGHALYNLGTPHVWTLAEWCARLRDRFPGFAYTVGGDAPEGAETIDLWGARDGGLLSWQRFQADTGLAAARDLGTAFDAYMHAPSLGASA